VPKAGKWKFVSGSRANAQLFYHYIDLGVSHTVDDWYASGGSVSIKGDNGKLNITFTTETSGAPSPVTIKGSFACTAV
jgi:hypothetical protein